jgi:hypothetical protein
MIKLSWIIAVSPTSPKQARLGRLSLMHPIQMKRLSGDV